MNEILHEGCLSEPSTQLIPIFTHMAPGTPQPPIETGNSISRRQTMQSMIEEGSILGYVCGERKPLQNGIKPLQKRPMKGIQ